MSTHSEQAFLHLVPLITAQAWKKNKKNVSLHVPEGVVMDVSYTRRPLCSIREYLDVVCGLQWPSYVFFLTSPRQPQRLCVAIVSLPCLHKAQATAGRRTAVCRSVGSRPSEPAQLPSRLPSALPLYYSCHRCSCIIAAVLGFLFASIIIRNSTLSAHCH